MKKFFSQVFATILGILLLCGFCVFALITIGFISSLFKPSKVTENSVLEITLKNGLMESPTEKETSLLSLKEEKSLYLKDLIELIKYAKTDEKIKGISLKIPQINTYGYAMATELREALKDFKNSKKFVYAYQNDASQKAYYVSSVADSLFLNPNAMLEITGISSELIFLKKFGEKFGVGFDVIRHGKYKAAVEPFLRDDMSSENEAQLNALNQDIWHKIQNDISSSRKIAPETLNLAIDSLNTFLPEMNLKNKLVDVLQYESEYEEVIKKKLGLTKDEKPTIISMEEYSTEVNTTESNTNKIGILYASGEIFNGEGRNAVYSEDFIKNIKKVKEEEEIKAVVLRINSPGGSANASDEILHELLLLKQKKPLIVSFSDVAASGGYYIAMAGDEIYAQENTITGSIGVLGMIPNIKKLANDTGITSDFVQTHSNTLYYSPLQGISTQAKNKIMKSIELTYKKFVGVVMKGRKMTFEQVDAIGGGHVWSGKEALKIGLIDKIGSLEDALHSAAKKAKITNYQTISYPEEESKWSRIFNNFEKTSLMESILKTELNKEEFKLYQSLKNYKNTKGLLMLYSQEFN